MIVESEIALFRTEEKKLLSDWLDLYEEIRFLHRLELHY